MTHGNCRGSSPEPTIGFLLEQTLGHVSHGRNLRHSLTEGGVAVTKWRELEYQPKGLVDRFPPRSNWTVRSGLAARRAVASLQAEGPVDALFVHTNVPATLLGSTLDRVPTVVSIDATPHQIDTLGDSYQHPMMPAPVEALKLRLHQRTFERAASLVTWSQWAADSLTADYGVDPDRIDVIPPGVVNSVWRRPSRDIDDSGTVRILFVGGDFERKGGAVLRRAVDAVANDPEVLAAGIEVELHLVTTAAVEGGAGVIVHRGLTPNSPELVDLYHRCDVFALPTLGDCSPMVLAEAAAAGLPSVTTDIGAIKESVLHGETGFLVAPDPEAVAAALRRLVLDPELRARLGRAAAAFASDELDAEANARRILRRLVEHTEERASSDRVLLTVSGDVDPDHREAAKRGERPLPDYAAIADATDAEVLDRTRLRAEASAASKLLARTAGADIAMAWHLFTKRRDFDVAVTDGEQVGMPLAALMRVFGRRGMRHVMIAHRLSVPKKSVPIRVLGLGRTIDDVLVYSSSQHDFAESLFKRHHSRLHLIDFMVDTEFFSRGESSAPAESSRPLICTAGREFRDYPTLVEAVRDLDVDVLIADASPWSKREDNAQSEELPDNVTVTSLTQLELRDALARSDLAVMPLQANDFQAGITTILEAMAMELPVVCTTTVGQIDVVVEDENGRYTPPGDVKAMRTAIVGLLDDPTTRARLGQAGRRFVEDNADVRHYAAAIAEIVAGPDHRPRRRLIPMPWARAS